MTNRSRHTRDIQAPPRLGPSTKQVGSKPVKILLSVLSVLVLLFSGLGYAAVGKLGNTLASAGKLNLGDGRGSGNAADGATDILLVGSDSRTDAQGNALTPKEIETLHAGDEQNDNTDTLMLIRVPNDGSSATAISIPRDTYIHDARFGDMKINGVYGAYKEEERKQQRDQGVTDNPTIERRASEAGRSALIQEISSLSGVTIDHYAEVGLLGFVLLTDAVGGVDVCLNEAVSDEYSGANFHAGVQTLNGAQALAYVRQRHGLPRGDLDRIVRQQSFMASLVNKVLDSGTLANPSKLTSMSSAVERSVVIDDGWDVVSFANQLQNLAGGNVKFNTIPVTSIDGTGTYGESIVTIDPDQVRTFFDGLLGQTKPTEEPQDPRKQLKLSVLNATSTEGLAGQLATYLKEEGYAEAKTDNASEDSYDHSQILAGDPNNEEVKNLAALLGLPVEQANDTDKQHVEIVISYDYAGPSEEQASADGTAGEETPHVAAGQPGTSDAPIIGPEIDAGGNGPRCVN